MGDQLTLWAATPTTTRWRCPKCSARVTLYITPTATPVCARHIRGGAEMKQETTP